MVEDVVKYVIEKMYAMEETERCKEHQKRAPSTPTNDQTPSHAENDQTALTAENSETTSTAVKDRKPKSRPDNYIFSGFFAFLLFGPFRCRPNDCLAYVEADDIGRDYDGNNIPSHCMARQIAQDQATTNSNKQGKKG